MTEKKRFHLVKCYNEQWGIVDNSLEEIDQLVLITTSKSGTGYIVNVLNELHKQLEPIQKICKKYNIEFTDVPEILEEYILIDNEVIEQKNIENIIKEAYQNERTALGKSVLKQLMEAIQ